MKNKIITRISFLLLLAVSLLTSCQQKKETGKDAATAISKNIDTQMVQLTDINVERLKVSQQHLGDNFDQRVSELIKEYENNKDYVSKVKSLDQLLREERFTSADKPAPTETKRTGYPGIIRYMTDDNFDLAIKSNDAFVAQVKFMNSKFNTLDQTTVEAINFYEQLSPDQKKAYFDMANKAKPKGGPIPEPDYQKYIARELLRGYYHYQYHIEALFYNYYKQKTLSLLKGYEGNQGNGGKTTQVIPDEKQFDLPFEAINNRK